MNLITIEMRYGNNSKQTLQHTESKEYTKHTLYIATT